MCICKCTFTYLSNSQIQRLFSHLPLGTMAAVHPETTFRHDILRSLVGRAASSTEAASDPLALLGLIIAGPLGMLEQVSKRAWLHCITPTTHCWHVP